MIGIPPEYLNQIVTGDARELAKRIPDESVDLILCDPPYLREFLWCYEWLGYEAIRILKPGGYCFAYGACEHMPARIAGMVSGGMNYFWIDALLHIGGYPRVWYKQLMSGYKPIIITTKGSPSILRWRATVGAVSADKRFHEWGQGDGYSIKIIDLLTNANAIIFDPFTGGGTVPAVCKMLGRNYIAFEIDPDVAERARERVRNTQPPLFVLQPEQSVMEFVE